MALGHKWLRFFKKRSPSLGKINGTRGYSRKCATHSDLTLFNAEWDEPWNIIEACPTLPPALKRVGSLWVAHGVAVSCGRACAIYFPQRRNPLTPSTQSVNDALPASRRRKFCLEALPTPGWIEGRSVDIGAGEARSAQPYSQPFKFLKEKKLQPFTF